VWEKDDIYWVKCNLNIGCNRFCELRTSSVIDWSRIAKVIVLTSHAGEMTHVKWVLVLGLDFGFEKGFMFEKGFC